MYPSFISRNSLGLAAVLLVQAGGNAVASNEADAFSDWWGGLLDLATLYENKDNPVIQKFAFTGRAQFDYVLIDGHGTPVAGFNDDDLDYEDFNTRRLRAGFKATLFHDFTAHVEADFDPDVDPAYQRLTDAYVGWKKSDALAIKVGKQSMGFTLDGATSSKELLTIERNNLSGNLWFTSEYAPGVSVGGTCDGWFYQVGVFSQGEADAEFGNFTSGSTWIGSVGYDFAGQLGVDEAALRFDYVYNEETPSRPELFVNRSLGQVVSLNARYHNGCYGVRADLAAGDGFLGQPDLWGFVVMPYVDLTDKLQLVARYTFVESDGNDGVRFNGRYDGAALNSRRGDQYQEGYLGMNYYLVGNNLKLQAGLQYLSMRDRANNGGAFDGWNLTTGLRISW
ncbi:porin [Luteolibacter marinus]|uniref:porin n=1 Tax=Luteolibacter marinus TaxID=2776705 RepID=UPI0018685E59|nr:porin [Luteolibacter marinus]